MDITFWLLFLGGLALALLIGFALRPRGGGEMLQGQQRAARRIAAASPHLAHRGPPRPPASPAGAAALLAIPEIRAALDGGRKIDAIKQIRERTGLGLKEAKDLVERLPG